MMRPGDGGVSRPEQERAENRKGGFADGMRTQFRAAMEALTIPAPEPEFKPRRSRVGDGEQHFGPAKTIFRRAARLLPFPAINPEWNTFTWLRIWEYQDATIMDDLGHRETVGSDLYPHLQP
jgi:hypothetical protein